MRKTLLSVAAVLGVAIAGVLIYAATKPDTFSVQRSAVIAAPPDKLFGLINEPKAFNTWNPYARKDPQVKLRYEGATSGPGAAYAWESESLGVGRMEVVESAAPTRVAMRLEFEKPMRAKNRVDFTLLPQGATTQVTWAMSGPMPYISKLFTTFSRPAEPEDARRARVTRRAAAHQVKVARERSSNCSRSRAFCRQRCGALEVLARFIHPAELDEQIGAHRVEQVVALELARRDERVDERQRLAGAERHAHRDGAVQLDDRRGQGLRECVIQRDDLFLASCSAQRRKSSGSRT